MPNTSTQIHIQCVFAVKHREALIDKNLKERLLPYMTQIIQGHGHKVLRINSMPDHLHVFFGFHPTQSLSDLIRTVKGDTSKWINDQKLTKGVFRWQEGYGAFSYSRSQVPVVAAYIEDQEFHHRKTTFLEEYRSLLNEFEIPFNESYLFRLPE